MCRGEVRFESGVERTGLVRTPDFVSQKHIFADSSAQTAQLSLLFIVNRCNIKRHLLQQQCFLASDVGGFPYRDSQEEGSL